ncbi:MAG: WD40 repeat domain-containing protein [Euryarchaeota archaeon]|nr:WD40 repeat domain-containing protein [Euryarchaeota archaeon]
MRSAPTMRRSLVALMLITLMLSLSLASAASSTVDVKSEGRITVEALGLETAETNPLGDPLLIAGADGFVRIISANSPTDASTAVELQHSNTNTLRDITWHPAGNTALIAGDSGTVLRYSHEDYALTTVSGTGALESSDISAIDWRLNGDYAYLGSASGVIYRYSSSEGFTLLDMSANSAVSAIECHEQLQLCLATTLSDGIAIIDRDHDVSWLGSSGDTWVDVDCPDVDLNECVAIASGRRISAIILNEQTPASTSIESPVIVGELGGEFVSISIMDDHTVIIEMAPFALIKFEMDGQKAYQVLEHATVSEASSTLAGTSLVATWGDDDTHGFMISSDGTVSSFAPPAVEDDVLMFKAIGVMVMIAVPGTILGLIFMNSKTLQGWYHGRRNAKREAKKQAELDEIKAQKVAERAAKNKK